MIDAMGTNEWEQQPGESSGQYARFLVYRNLRKERSLKKAVEKFSGGEKGHRRATVSGYWRRLCQRWRWKERAEAWDRHVEEVAGEATKDAAVRMREMTIEIVNIYTRESLELLNTLRIESQEKEWNRRSKRLDMMGKSFDNVLRAYNALFNKGKSLKSRPAKRKSARRYGYFGGQKG